LVQESDLNNPHFEAGRPNCEALLDGFLGTIARMTGACAAAVRLFSDDEKTLHLGASVGLPEDVLEREAVVPRHCGACGQTMDDTRIHSASTQHCAGRVNSRFFKEECKHVVAVPLSFRGQPIGVFNLFFEEYHELAADALPMLNSYAELIGLSLENARLTRENQRMTLIAERQAIANEIHDSLSQTLFYGRLRLSVLAEALRNKNEVLATDCVDDIGDAIDAGQKSVRELITHFRCQMDPLGLHHALQALVDGMGDRSAITFEFSHPISDPGLTLEQELQIFHIVREALNNIVAHSGATEARLLVQYEDDVLIFRIDDNGSGMASLDSPSGHYGLTIMRERAKRIGAQLDITSSPGAGTHIQLALSTL
jgi:two-component system nitrate/nitrite sensor histidine kinase NarX